MNNIKFTELKKQGVIAFRAALEESGGILSLDDVVDLLNIPSTEVLERVENKSLLAVHFDEKLQFPTWQFDGAETVEKLSDILTILKDFSPSSAILFFITPDSDLKCTPITALKTRD